jgi:hypothetical protein
MKNKRRRIKKSEFYERGAWANSDLFRRQATNGRWYYYEVKP